MSKRIGILLVDDDSNLLSTLELTLKSKNNVFLATSGKQAFEQLKKQDIQLILLDLKLPDGNGIEFLKRIKKNHPDIDVIMLTAVHEIEQAVKAIKAGASNYLTKDFALDEILSTVDAVCEKRRKAVEIISLKSELFATKNKKMILGRSEKSQKLMEIINKVAPLPANVLITGESGTGKELVARMIHKYSARCSEPLVTCHIASIPTTLVESTLFGHERGSFTGATHQLIGKFEMADGGTLVLDEVSEISPDVQVKLLRFLQEEEIDRIGRSHPKKVDVRLIAITNRNLADLVAKNLFREDLYYRLKTVPVEVPPLRHRQDDIPDLIEEFLNHFAKKFCRPNLRIEKPVIDALIDYPWPGNIRECEHLVEHLLALADGDLITYDDLPLEYVVRGLTNIENNCEKNLKKFLKTSVMQFEKQLVKNVMKANQGNRKRTAESLGISLSTLKLKLRQ